LKFINTYTAVSCLFFVVTNLRGAEVADESDLLEQPIDPPTALLQRNLDDTVIGLVGTSKSDTVKLGAKIRYGSVNACEWDFTLEVEVVEHPGRFQWRPTHSFTLHKKGSEGTGQQFVEVIATGLKLGKFFKWNVRQVVQSFRAHYDLNNGTLTCIRSQTYASDWHPGVVTGSTSFRTPVPYQNVIEYPADVEVTTGLLRDGNSASLRADDGNYYRVRSSNSDKHELEWHAKYTNITPQSRNAVIRVRSSADRVCEETLDVWVPSANDWKELSSSNSSSNEREWSASMQSFLANFLDEGVLLFRLTCSRNGQRFSHSTEILEFSYERAMVPWVANEPE